MVTKSTSLLPLLAAGLGMFGSPSARAQGAPVPDAVRGSPCTGPFKALGSAPSPEDRDRARAIITFPLYNVAGDAQKRAALEKAVVLDPKWHEAWAALSDARRWKQDDRGAIVALCEAAALGYPDWDMLGFLWLTNGKPQAAVWAYRKILESRPSDEFIHRRLAESIAATGDTQGGLREYSALLMVSGNSQTILDEYNDLRRRMGLPEQGFEDAIAFAKGGAGQVGASSGLTPAATRGGSVSASVAPGGASAPRAQSSQEPRTIYSLVFFDADSSTMTASARDILLAAVELFGERHPSIISVTGHTDTLGTRTANQALSERRAAVVKSFLTSAGFAAASIITNAVGEDELLVQTADEVREKQNDYVNVEFRP